MADGGSSASATAAGEDYPVDPSEYTLLEVVGEGAFAKVYKARCKASSEEVAIKVIQLDKVQTPIEVIQNEVRAMAMCRHENVLPLLSCFVHEAELWLVSPLMDKGSAYNVLKQAGKVVPTPSADQPRIPEEAIRAILLQTLEGLAYLHSQKQIHRDIKAGNILLNSKCEVKIGDFGVAGWMNDDLTREDGRRDTFVGTPCWMAPEVMEQTKGYNERADIWSLGITALELAMGKAPYASLPPMQVLMHTLNHDPPSLQSYKDAGITVPRLSADFSRFVRLCLTKDPTKRPSAADLLKERYVKAAKIDSLVEILGAIPAIGTKEAGAPGAAATAAEAATIPGAPAFANGTTWVFWEGSGSVSGTSKRPVEPAATSDDAMMELVNAIGEGGEMGEMGEGDEVLPLASLKHES